MLINTVKVWNSILVFAISFIFLINSRLFPYEREQSCHEKIRRHIPSAALTLTEICINQNCCCFAGPEWVYLCGWLGAEGTLSIFHCSLLFQPTLQNIIHHNILWNIQKWCLQVTTNTVLKIKIKIFRLCIVPVKRLLQWPQHEGKQQA